VTVVKKRKGDHTSDKYLLAYYVADKKLDETKMLAYLAARLPEYMCKYSKSSGESTLFTMVKL